MVLHRLASFCTLAVWVSVRGKVFPGVVRREDSSSEERARAPWDGVDDGCVIVLSKTPRSCVSLVLLERILSALFR
jgi:hypothetical protein